MIHSFNQYFIQARTYCIVVLIFCTTQVNSQVKPFNDILKKVISDTHSSFSDFSRQLRNIDYKLPLFEKFEIRPNTDRMTFARQQFTLRASFNTLAQRRTHYDKQQAYLNVQDEEAGKFNRTKIFNTYQRYIRLSRQSSEIVLLQKERVLLQKQLDITEQILSAGQSVDLSDYMQLRTELMESLTLLEEKVTEYQNLASLLGIDTSLQVHHLSLGEEEIAAIVSALKLDTSLIMDAKSKKVQMAYLEASSKAEKADASRILDFVQTRYSVREDLLLENRFSVGFGLQFPYQGSSKLKLADIATRQKVTERDISEIIEVTAEEYKIKKSEFQRKLTLNRQLKEISGEEKYVMLKAKIMESGKLHPLKYHDVLMNELNLEKKSTEARFDLLNLYLELLHLTGKIYEVPYKNYLETGTPIIL